MLTRRLALSAVLASAVAVPVTVPAAAAVAKPRPLPASDVASVSVAPAGRGAYVVRFARTRSGERSYARVAGRRVVLSCGEVGRNPLRSRGASPGTTTIRLPREPSELRVDHLTRGFNLCMLRLRATAPPVITFALDRDGRAFLAEQVTARTLLALVDAARRFERHDARHAYPSAAVLSRLVGRRVVALASPTATPPGAVPGAYSEAGRRFAAVAVAATGRRMYFELDGRRVRSNFAARIAARR